MAILEHAAESPRSTAELLSSIGISVHSANVRRHIAPLLESGLLELTQPDHPRSPTQKYRITQAGRRALTHPRDEK
ncbi:MAG: hypothetical protein FWH11_06685 [Micrococcales bacterium]|nr:hypothetical protein [Micrococcales bacterium]